MGNRHAKTLDAAQAQPEPLEVSTGLESDQETKHTYEEDLSFLQKHFDASDIKRVMNRVALNTIPETISTAAELREVLENLDFFETEWFKHFLLHCETIRKQNFQQITKTRAVLLGSNEFLDMVSATLFAELDQNGDGKISQRELLFAILAYGQDKDVEVLRLRYNIVDKDHSRALTSDELLAWMMDTKRYELKLTKVTVRAGFASMLDQDDLEDPSVARAAARLDKIVSDYLNAVDATMQKRKDDILKEYLKLNDTNRDGVISFDEFVRGSSEKQIKKLKKFNEKLISKETGEFKSKIAKLSWDMLRDKV